MYCVYVCNVCTRCVICHLQEALMECVASFGRASNYTVNARGHVVELLVDINQLVCCRLLACVCALSCSVVCVNCTVNE